MVPSSTLSAGLAAIGIVAGALVGLASRRVSMAIAVALDLWTAASLIHLTEDQSWSAIATAAGIVGIRKAATRAFFAAR
jgi:hypothetical protein